VQVVNATKEEGAGVRYELTAKMTIECKAGTSRTLRFDTAAWAPAGGELDVTSVKNVSGVSDHHRPLREWSLPAALRWAALRCPNAAACLTRISCDQIGT
jgi:hypothetical protein